MRRLERLLSIALVLSARRRVRAADLATQFSISERTVYRDMRAIQDAGFPIEGNPGDGYLLPADAYLRPLGFSEAEAVALAMSAQVLGATADESLREALAAATAKLESSLGPGARARVRRFRAETYLSGSVRRSSGPLGRVLDALDARDVLEISYQPVAGGKAGRRQIEPLGLIRVEDAWLLVAYCRLRRDARAFRVDRIREVRSTGQRYQPREGYSFAEVIAREKPKFPGS